jgi:3-hydroxy-9,10-secoandrosta-1,3,5(10)-triene-9,17-dione monooxygenase reductase component
MSAQAPIDPAAFRRAMGQFATGVTVITVQHGDHIHGMTANAFSSVSLDPPLVLFCVTRTARMATLLTDAPGFAINILADTQQEVSRQFAGANKEHLEKTVALHRGPVAPLIDGCLVSLSCLTEAMHDGGDHWIVVGRVVAIHEHPEAADADPLVFFRSRYRDLVPLTVAPAPVESWSNDEIRIYHEEWSAGVEDDYPERPYPW